MSVTLKCFEPWSFAVCVTIAWGAIEALNAPAPPKLTDGLTTSFKNAESVVQIVDNQIVTLEKGQKKTYSFEVAQMKEIQFERGYEIVANAGTEFLNAITASIELRASQSRQAGFMQEERGAASVQVDGDKCTSYNIEKIRNYREGTVNAPHLNGGTAINFKFLESFDINAKSLCSMPATAPIPAP